MDDRVQLVQPATVGEDDAPQGRPVQAAIALDHVRPERHADGGQARRTGLDHLTGEDVGVDDEGTQRRQPAGDGRLP